LRRSRIIRWLGSEGGEFEQKETKVTKGEGLVGYGRVKGEIGQKGGKTAKNTKIAKIGRTRGGLLELGLVAGVVIFWIGGGTGFAQWPFGSPSPAGAGASATPFGGFDDAGNGDAADVPMVEKAFDPAWNQQIDPLGQKALAIRPQDWRHAETENFILHYRRVTEARKVAREVEFDLAFVAGQFGATKEQYARKSHVFIFEDDKEWHVFLAQTPVAPWAGSFAHGDELFLDLRNNGSGEAFDSRTLAHETTHAVVARIYPAARWPVWLNEGVAEYMGAASVAARKNQTVKRQEHNLNFASMPLDEMQALQTYPQDVVKVTQLYETGEKLIRFIMTELPRDRFVKFVKAVGGGESLQTALMEVYPDKLASYDDFEKKFARFSK
jgi:hypothetical protein